MGTTLGHEYPDPLPQRPLAMNGIIQLPAPQIGGMKPIPEQAAPIAKALAIFASAFLRARFPDFRFRVLLRLLSVLRSKLALFSLSLWKLAWPATALSTSLLEDLCFL